MDTVVRNDSPRFLSVSETAIRLGVNGATIRRWVRDGHLRAAQPGGQQGVLRIPEGELERLIERARDSR
jgi:excisionase family DNA binding protein